MLEQTEAQQLNPKLFLYVCYFLFKIGFDRVTFTSRESMRGQNGENSTLFIHLLFPISISGDSVSYVIKMIMLICCNMTHTKQYSN